MARGKKDKQAAEDQAVASAIAELWLRGELAWTLKPHKQTDAYEFIRSYRSTTPDQERSAVVLEAHRRFGKSRLFCTLAIEECLRRPGRVVRYLAPEHSHCEAIVRPLMSEILLSCPRGLWEYADEEYLFRNPRWPSNALGSVLSLHGADSRKHMTRLRGPRSDIIMIDEAGYLENLKSLIGEVLIHHFQTRDDPLLLMASSPPDSMDHDFIRHYIPKAISRRSYFRVPGSENPDFSERDKLLVLSEVGDERSEAYLREIELHHIANQELMVIPEFAKVKHLVVVEQHAQPKYFIPLVFADMGLSDFTGGLFCYVDFNSAQLVIVDELLAHYLSTEELSSRFKDKEESLGWAQWARKEDGTFDKRMLDFMPQCGHKLRRLADQDEQQRVDFARSYGLGFGIPDKWNKEAAINDLRSGLVEGKVRIHAKCKQLIYQLENALWAPNRREFARSPTLGHVDLVDALIYAYRMAPWRTNPGMTPRRSSADIFQVERTGRWADERIDKLFNAHGELLDKIRGSDGRVTWRDGGR